MMRDVVIIGSGMAGLSAAIYSKRYNLDTLVIGKEIGGTTTKAWIIENYPGFEKIDGYDLMMKVKDQVTNLGCEIMTDAVKEINKSNDSFTLITETDQVVKSRVIIFALGAARRKLGLPKEEEFAQGKGVHYCTTCDGPLYKNKTIIIAGGGDAAVKGANLAVQYAKEVFIVVKNDKLTSEPINHERLMPYIKSGKVKVIFNQEISEILGRERFSGVKLKNGQEINADGLFVEIGAVAQVKIAQDIGVTLDESGYIKVNNMMETSVKGAYAAGDVTNFFGSFKQDITAGAMGAVAATSAFHYLQKSR